MQRRKGPKKQTIMTPSRHDPLALTAQTPNVVKRSYKDVMNEKNLEKMRVVDQPKPRVRFISHSAMFADFGSLSQLEF